MKNTSITNKLAFYSVAISIAAVGTLGILFYLQAKEALLDRAFDQLTSIRTVKKRQIENYFEDRIADAQILRDVLLNKGGSSNFSHKSEENSLAYIKDNLSSDFFKSIIAQKYYRGFIIITDAPDSSMTEAQELKVALLNKKKILPFYDVITNSTNNLQIFEYPDSGGNSEYHYYIPFYSDSANQLLIELNLESLNNFMLENDPYSGLGNSGESYIVGSDMKMRTKSRFLNDTIKNVLVPSLGAKNSAKGITGTSIYEDYRGVKVLGSYERLNIHGLKWYILAEIDLNEVNEPISKMGYNIMIFVFLTSLVAFILTYFISKRITGPVINLTHAAEELGKGYYPRVDVPETSDEISMLAQSFNNMANKLELQEKELAVEKIQRTRAAIEAEELERERLSRELHDGLGQLLIALKLKLEGIDLADRELTRKVLIQSKSAIDEIINEIRNMSNDLIPSVLIEFGIVNAIKNLCSDLNEVTGIEINFTVSEDLPRPGKKVNINIYRIVQESLKNIINHSKATKAAITLYHDNKNLMLSIQDNGIGFKKNEIKSGKGLYNISERINLLSGSLSILTEPGNGTLIKIIIPLENLS